MNRFLSAMKAAGGVLLLGGFLWLGVPRCSEVESLTDEERRWVTLLCRRVSEERFVDARPERLSVREWRAAVRAYRSADVDDDDAVLDRLAARLQGR